MAAVALALLAGVSVASTGIRVARAQAAARSRRPALLELLKQRTAEGDQLRGKLRDLRRELEALARQEIGASGLSGEVATLRLAAGLTAVEGPGVEVVMADSPLASRVGRSDPRYRIQDLDVQRLINELWALGAEAVAVNGERTGALTPVRMAGNVLLVGVRPVGSPYKVQAVGDPERLYSGLLASEVGKDLRSWSSLYGIRFEVRKARSMSLPAPSEPSSRSREGLEPGGGRRSPGAVGGG